jgi:2,4-dienoyl-CoA reductase-like NADH-dependent reductase (Old Yellow Enzyme family)
MDPLFQPLAFAHGPSVKNRFMLAPMTNTQSHEDGTLSDDEFAWLVMRAKGGFGQTMTCASHVQAMGKGFPGQLGVFSDIHIPGLTRLATAIKEHSSMAMVQLHHAGMRSPEELIGAQPLCPSADEKTGARAMSAAEVATLIEDFVSAAERAKTCGFDGVQVHGAHGYILGQFLSPTINQREDKYGGSVENRSRIVFEILDAIRQRCGPDFHLGLRLSPERFGQKLEECLSVAERVMKLGTVDSLDMSLWDFAKEAHEEEFQGRPLRSYFLDLERGGTRLGLAGKIFSAADARQCLEEGYDFVTLGRAAILHHDFPRKVEQDANFVMADLPVSREYLKNEGLSEAFVKYMSNWDGFVAD